MHYIAAPTRVNNGRAQTERARRVKAANVLARRINAARELLEAYGYPVGRPTFVHPDLVDATVLDKAA